MSALEKLQQRKAAKEEKPEIAAGDDELIKGIMVPVTVWRERTPVRCYVLLSAEAANKELIDAAMDEVEEVTGLKIDVYKKNGGDGGNSSGGWRNKR